MNERSLQNAFFLLLLLVTSLAFFGLIQALLQPIFWAAVLAIIFHPLYGWCNRRLGGWPNVASAATIVIIVLLVIIPLFLTGFAVAAEASSLYSQLATGQIDPQSVVEWLERTTPAIVDLFSRFGLSVEELRTQLSDAAVRGSRYLATGAVDFGQNAIRVSGLSFLMLYLLFFFLRDGTRILDTIVGAAPIGDVRERRLLTKFAEVSRATLKGTLVIGIVQGGLGGLLFWLLGIEAAVLWGVVMGILSLLPAVGAALVWIPAAAILMIAGHLMKGVLLVVFGTLIIGLADNVLRPLLVGRDTQMPDYVILVATLGGLTLFGISGIIIGPVIASLFLAVWDMFVEEYAGAANDEGVLSTVDEPSTSESAAEPSAS